MTPGSPPFRTELWRKTIHVTTGAVPLLYAFWDHRAAMAVLMGSLTVIMLVIEWARRRPGFAARWFGNIFGFMLRQREHGGALLGSTAYCSASLLTILLFPRPVAVLALLFLAFGDTAASLVGLHFGRHRVGPKSLEGALAFCLVAGVLVLLARACSPDYPLAAGLLATPVTAAAEMLLWRVDDNWTVPLVAGATMSLWLWIT